jgi:SAM-dependent methyltransferase
MSNVAWSRVMQQRALDRRDRLTRLISREQRGIEIGPYFNPLAPKREGYNCLVIDVADREALRRQAQTDDPLIPSEKLEAIEEVDIVGTSGDLPALLGARGELASFDYVLSAHNLEHLPDPIRFLQGCAEVLKPGGVVSMAVPDHRVCYDYFQSTTTTADWLAAFLERRTRPTPAQVFRFASLFAMYESDGKAMPYFLLSDDPRQLVASRDLDRAYAEWRKAAETADTQYRDVHCWQFTPASLELLLLDARRLGLVTLNVEEISPTTGSEFHVHLRKPADTSAALDDEAFWQRRSELLFRTVDERGRNTREAYRSQLLVKRLALRAKRWGRDTLRGTALGAILVKALRR